MTGTNTAPSAVDEEIFNCLDLDSPKSFFLFAGAGSGKTRSLVEALKRFRENNIVRLRKNGQKIAVITYTNAACDEIKSRLEFDLAFHVSTIHRFAWNMINPYTHDIRNWLASNLQDEIAKLNDLQGRARSTTNKSYIKRAKKIELKSKRLGLLPSIKKFTYSPNGDNIEKDSLNHEEVIKITAHFIQDKPLMQSILIRKFPIILIDESQDTKKDLVDAFFDVQEKHPDKITLGLFGDTMQRIYTDGKTDLGKNIPDDWEKPAKVKNYRCPRRVITLINRIRSDADDQIQEPHKENDGCVRLFIVNTSNPINKSNVESGIISTMAELTGDPLWEDDAQNSVKILTLEHHMAAIRGGFSDFFVPLYSVDKLKTGLLDGKLTGVSLFAKQVLPLVKAKQVVDEFAVSRIMRENSPIIEKVALKNSAKSLQEITKAKEAVVALFSLWSDDNDPSLNEVLREVVNSGIFKVPDVLVPITDRFNEEQNDAAQEQDEEPENDPVLEAWETALQCSFSQFEEYVRYISDESRFGTHQGIKGLQFPRVMVILDDDEARGWSFSFDKLFGVVEPTKNDLKNIKEGKETIIDRTRRLFYVTCSRAEESLAIVAYTNESNKVEHNVLEQGWFDGDEIIKI